MSFTMDSICLGAAGQIKRLVFDPLVHPNEETGNFPPGQGRDSKLNIGKAISRNLSHSMITVFKTEIMIVCFLIQVVIPFF